MFSTVLWDCLQHSKKGWCTEYNQITNLTSTVRQCHINVPLYQRCCRVNSGLISHSRHDGCRQLSLWDLSSPASFAPYKPRSLCCLLAQYRDPSALSGGCGGHGLFQEANIKKVCELQDLRTHRMINGGHPSPPNFAMQFSSHAMSRTMQLSSQVIVYFTSFNLFPL